MIIYKITNKINGKCYIGQTKHQLNFRWVQHCQIGSKSVRLNRAIAKYGRDSFSKEIIGEYDNQADLDLAEAYFIEFHNCVSPNGYNLKLGGLSGGPLSEESREKIRKSKIGSKRSEESKLKQGSSIAGEKHHFFGKKRSSEDIAKISAALKGKITWMKGRKHTEESKKKNSASKIGKSLPETTRQKMRGKVSKFRTPIFCLNNGVSYPSQSQAAK